MPLSMNNAKAKKLDEFYTFMPDIEEELNHYQKFFFDKVVYCCCDNPIYSNFYKYFKIRFYEFGLRQLIASCNSSEEREGICSIYDGQNETLYSNINGDICSSWFCSMVAQCDIIVTNPPFSKSKMLLNYLINEDKKFIVVGNRNHLTSDLLFSFFMKGKIKLGYGFKNATGHFFIPKFMYGHYSKDVTRDDINVVRFRNVVWYTNFDIEVPPRKRLYTKQYDAMRYQKYDNYDAINVDKISDIPADYYGEMGVPITILDGFDYNEFEILGIDRTIRGNVSGKRFSINGKNKYVRIIVKRKYANETI